MVLWATILILQGAGFVGSVTGIPGVPENITVMFLNPTSVRVSWSTSQVEQVEKYDVTYKPTDASYRVVAVVAGNSEAVTLSGLRADTQYQLVVTAVRAGKKFRSRPIVFRTLGKLCLPKLYLSPASRSQAREPPRTSPQQDAAVTGGPLPPPPPSSQQPQQPYIQIRGVEVGIVVLVLIVWAGAIALFFNRWGKIRMLLPYQPDYKEQLKVPGTGVCAAANAAYTQHPTQHACSQHLHWSSHHVDSLDSGGALGWPRTPRPRVNSAIDVAGFLSQEFLRRHGSTSKLCRKVRSADNLPLASTNRQDPRRNSKDEGVEGDRESFLKPSQDDRSEDQDSRRQSSLDSAPKDNTETSLLEPNNLQPSSRDSPVASSSLVARRFSGWRNSGNHEYVPIRCPVRQPASMDERCYRRYDSETTRPSSRYHHRRPDADRHSKSCDYSRRTTESSIEVQHFGLPILSVSEPSPPDESERVDDYL
ncbi:uncharacterized protein LOC116846808 isoform X1 [Odontomachus brunneus]|uniref:uncharacterized protein LOC116846808 isoform X1 n=1 Tax=Odontomachus brunneus TaxID=486640 RepID=UPI0013F27A38|nr:uncharacterized protein LOC116846808 isoform X1 [Odontomachus brunneus]XP_032677027.1 uncharacterized protein LOC116846808 isoform X1 [Odontomachus brunneus]XP_032677036.1 uncharacterized protein LOC116846808 isoform X1 [Odontomachus brunneus]XP_032677046.1 uncharacterized protein LOC116846808 isoform X1 [Odontomachus brunneus]XP_032677054.1 uncharacterized protein LOC116846808 isoform X1 [Odontomachus brunneus]XP_032677060.1 uncharacterized protein LOC116846808 isoform X1 [Odontomachus bru